jgi:hypothetical protein
MATRIRGNGGPAPAKAVAPTGDALWEDPLRRSAHFRLLSPAERRRLLGHGTERVLREWKVFLICQGSSY